MTSIKNCFLLCNLICLLFLSGCASLFNNDSQSIRIHTSNNQPVKVEIDQPHIAPYTLTTPDFIRVQPSSFEPMLIKVNDPCYLSGVTNVKTTIKPIYWANLFTYFIGFPVDYMTGHMWRYDDVVTIPVTPTEDNAIDCQEKPIVTVEKKQAPKIYTPRFQPHRISAGFIKSVASSRAGTITGDDGGFYIEYSYRLDTEFMTNIKYQYGSSGENYDCPGTFENYCNLDINTEQMALSFSLRHYLTPKSSFYAGIGGAQIFIQQDTRSFSNAHFNDRSEARTSNIFLDFGWQPRSSKAGLHINGTIDLADIHLSSPTLKHTKTEISPNQTEYTRQKADGLFRHASIISNISLGVVLSF